MKIGLNDSKSWMAVISLAYAISFISIYVYYIHKYFAYAGYNIEDNSYVYMAISLIISLTPILFFKSLGKISDFASLLIYIFGYIPTILSIQLLCKAQLTTVLYQLAIMVGMMMFFRASVNKESLLSSIKPSFSIGLLNIITIIFTLVLINKFLGRMSFVSFDEVYEHRSSNTEYGLGFVGYIIMWLTYTFYPFYLSYGMFYKKVIYIIAGIVGHVIIYMCTASKASLLMPLILFGVYIILNLKRKSFFVVLTIILIAFSQAILLWVDNPIVFIIASVFLIRTLSMAGLLSAQYLTFFLEHPYTNYAHINFINYITGAYPYGDTPLGIAVGNFFMPYYDETSPIVNANAGFWATDGIAANGLLGILIVNIIVYYLLKLLNNVTLNKQLLFTSVFFTPSILALLNVSIFTTLLSCGLIFNIFIMLKMKLPNQI